jgi:hypothetical protein
MVADKEQERVGARTFLQAVHPFVFLCMITYFGSFFCFFVVVKLTF